MKILSAEFIKSCYETEQFPRDRLREVAFVGRSNVGKSSLINSLLNRRKLVKISRTPGKTRSINFFRVTTGGQFRDSFHIVDLPGYGYAAVSRSVRAQWGPMIEGYLNERSELRGVVLLVDSRGIERDDHAALEWLMAVRHRLVVVATKVDKLSRSERSASLAAIRDGLGVPADVTVLPYSSVTHEGRDQLWRVLVTLLE